DRRESVRNQTFAEPVTQMGGLFTFHHLSHDWHVVTLFKRDTCGSEIDIHFIHLVLRKGSQIDLHYLLLFMRRQRYRDCTMMTSGGGMILDSIIIQRYSLAYRHNKKE